MAIRIHNADCLLGMKELTARSVDMILSDLPFGSTSCRWDKKLPLAALWAEFNRVLKDNGACVLFAQMPFAAELVMTSPIKFRYKWCWEKPLGTGFFNARKMPLRCHEDILVFYRKLPTYNPQWRRGEPYRRNNRQHWQGEGVYNYSTPRTDGANDGEHYYPRDVIKFASPMTTAEPRYHSTQKPLSLLEYLIRTYTDAGELVLDATAGSASTAIACLNTGRNFVGYEVDAQIYSIAAERLARAEVETLNLSAV